MIKKISSFLKKKQNKKNQEKTNICQEKFFLAVLPKQSGLSGVIAFYHNNHS
jgi:hypothetical protein